MERLTRVLRKVSVAITVVIVFRARSRGQRTTGVQPDVRVGVSDPVCDWRLCAELVSNGGVTKLSQYLGSRVDDMQSEDRHIVYATQSLTVEPSVHQESVQRPQSASCSGKDSCRRSTAQEYPGRCTMRCSESSTGTGCWHRQTIARTSRPGRS